MTEYAFTINGDVPSKANSYKIVTINRHATLAKTARLTAYEKAFFLQCPLRNADIKSFFVLYLDVYYVNNRKDLDGSFKIILDCLQRCKAIHNDRECVEIHARKLIDPTNPRIEVRLTTVDNIMAHATPQRELFDDNE